MKVILSENPAAANVEGFSDQIPRISRTRKQFQDYYTLIVSKSEDADAAEVAFLPSRRALSITGEKSGGKVNKNDRPLRRVRGSNQEAWST